MRFKKFGIIVFVAVFLVGCAEIFDSIDNQISQIGSSQTSTKTDKTTQTSKTTPTTTKSGVKNSSADFFTAMGDSEAASIVKGTHKNTPSWFAQSKTTLGASNDATNLQNMKASLAIIKQTNAKRKSEGKSALKVSHKMMAISQIRTNYAAHYKFSHAPLTGVARVAENLAKGQANGTVAVNAWYSEKSNCPNKSDKNCKFSAKTGHYLNLVNSSYLVTGAGLANKTYGGVYGSGGNAYTIEQYEAMFNKWLNGK
nr:hypothetical protein [Campylobacter sp.]